MTLPSVEVKQVNGQTRVQCACGDNRKGCIHKSWCDQISELKVELKAKPKKPAAKKSTGVPCQVWVLEKEDGSYRKVRGDIQVFNSRKEAREVEKDGETPKKIQAIVPA